MAACRHTQARSLRRLALLALLLGAALPATAVPAAAPPEQRLELYNGARGGTPDTQGLFFYAVGGGAQQSFANGATTLDTTTRNADLAGYFANSARLPPLKRSAGFTLTFQVQIESELHAGSDKNGDGIDDRAGFSVIALADDIRGIELGFWPDSIWAQQGGSGPTLFTQAERAAHSTAAMQTYHLEIQGDGYALYAEDAVVLRGPLRDYSAFTGLYDPYETPNFVFLGDDTSSARARIQLVYVAVRLPSSRVYLPLALRPS